MSILDDTQPPEPKRAPLTNFHLQIIHMLERYYENTPVFLPFKNQDFKQIFPYSRNEYTHTHFSTQLKVCLQGDMLHTENCLKWSICGIVAMDGGQISHRDNSRGEEENITTNSTGT